MKLPRDLSGKRLASALERLDYKITRQMGSHLRLTWTSPNVHHLTIPNHACIKVGTLSSILRDLACHHGLSREELLERLFS